MGTASAVRLDVGARGRFPSTNFPSNFATARSGAALGLFAPPAADDAPPPAAQTAAWLTNSRFTGDAATQASQLFIGLESSACQVFSDTTTLVRAFNNETLQVEEPRPEAEASELGGFLYEAMLIDIVDVRSRCVPAAGRALLGEAAVSSVAVGERLPASLSARGRVWGHCCCESDECSFG